MGDTLEAALEQAATRQLSVQDLFQVAQTLKQEGRPRAVQALYTTWIQHNEDHPLSYAVMFNHAVTLSDSGDLNGARGYLERAVTLNPDFMPGHINLGRVHEGLGAPDKAVQQWSDALGRLGAVTGSAVAHKTIALTQAARVLEASHQDEPAEDLLRQLLEIDPAHREATQHFVALRQRQCKWPVLPALERADRSSLAAGMSPLSVAAFTDDPLFQLAVNWNYNKHDVGDPRSAVITDHAAAMRPGKLRIGYLSSDLREHAVGYLMAEVFEQHDRDRVEVFAYYCGPKSTDRLHERFRASADHWCDLAGMDDAATARRMAADGIQILVDVNGYTREARNKLLVLRPAPIIVNWLGFPGSMASPYHHYIIADDWIIPPEYEAYFTERVLRVDCYQPNDRTRVVADRAVTRAEAGLPENAAVYCCFNGLHKVTPFVFDRWMAILAQVPGSVLWLLSSDEATHDRLRARATQNGVDPARLVFAIKRVHAEHLARYVLADLFLDTAPYGAHTTASDALWMGIPVLTMSGRSFAARVCGSLVRAAGTPELVCETPAEFIAQAVALGSDRTQLAAYRTRLLAGRDTNVLFDTPNTVRGLERAYEQMWAEFTDGSLPQPDLANLDVLLELGSLTDHDTIDFATVDDYAGWWRRLLDQRDQFRPVPRDTRGR
ncbi:glycosyl transferase [Acidisphaera sp. L21]|uniref:O-linked N-acetylglucosamine transferase, SPINDLY family protein n=1 Tax=Acidisphaera sp. L21 TaxID=1641851 RepID=UPI00131E7942|nr:glycosyl transferase [Acidisphaera sp. L21]